MVEEHIQNFCSEIKKVHGAERKRFFGNHEERSSSWPLDAYGIHPELFAAMTLSKFQS